MTSTDILLPDAVAARVSRTKLAALLPITLAVAGVMLILVGGVNARNASPDLAVSANIDPIITGSVMTPDDRREALIMLDR